MREVNDRRLRILREVISGKMSRWEPARERRMDGGHALEALIKCWKFDGLSMVQKGVKSRTPTRQEEAAETTVEWNAI